MESEFCLNAAQDQTYSPTIPRAQVFTATNLHVQRWAVKRSQQAPHVWVSVYRDARVKLCSFQSARLLWNTPTNNHASVKVADICCSAWTPGHHRHICVPKCCHVIGLLDTYCNKQLYLTKWPWGSCSDLARFPGLPTSLVFFTDLSLLFLLFLWASCICVFPLHVSRGNEFVVKLAFFSSAGFSAQHWDARAERCLGSVWDVSSHKDAVNSKSNGRQKRQSSQTE